MPWLAGGDQDKAHERRRGAEAVLELRAVQANGDFDEYCTFHLDGSGNESTNPATQTASSRSPRRHSYSAERQSSSVRRHTSVTSRPPCRGLPPDLDPPPRRRSVGVHRPKSPDQRATPCRDPLDTGRSFRSCPCGPAPSSPGPFEAAKPRRRSARRPGGGAAPISRLRRRPPRRGQPARHAQRPPRQPGAHPSPP